MKIRLSTVPNVFFPVFVLFVLTVSLPQIGKYALFLTNLVRQAGCALFRKNFSQNISFYNSQNTQNSSDMLSRKSS